MLNATGFHKPVPLSHHECGSTGPRLDDSMFIRHSQESTG